MKRLAILVALLPLTGACGAPVAFFAVETKPGLATLSAVETALEAVDPLPTADQIARATSALAGFEAADWPSAPADVRKAAGILVAAIGRDHGPQDSCSVDCYQPSGREVEAALAKVGAWVHR